MCDIRAEFFLHVELPSQDLLVSEAKNPSALYTTSVLQDRQRTRAKDLRERAALPSTRGKGPTTSSQRDLRDDVNCGRSYATASGSDRTRCVCRSISAFVVTVNSDVQPEVFSEVMVVSVAKHVDIIS